MSKKSLASAQTRRTPSNVNSSGILRASSGGGGGAAAGDLAKSIPEKGGGNWKRAEVEAILAAMGLGWKTDSLSLDVPVMSKSRSSRIVRRGFDMDNVNDEDEGAGADLCCCSCVIISAEPLHAGVAMS